MNTESERMTLREIQLEELDILLKATDFLDKHKIHYILCGGTLLGAVRHGGFIPWDDDIDLFVPRDDFEKLRQIVQANREIFADTVFSLPGDENYIFPFIKVWRPSISVESMKTAADNRLWIDIFPMDHFPDSKIMHILYLTVQYVQMKCLAAATFTEEYARKRGWYNNIFKRLVFMGAKLMYKCLGSYKGISRRMDTVARHMDRKYKSSNHVGDGAWPNGMNDYYHVSCVSPVRKMNFEGHLFNVPENYDACLTTFYGDYMTPPPEDKRQKHYLTAYRVKS